MFLSHMTTCGSVCQLAYIISVPFRARVLSTMGLAVVCCTIRWSTQEQLKWWLQRSSRLAPNMRGGHKPVAGFARTVWSDRLLRATQNFSKISFVTMTGYLQCFPHCLRSSPPEYFCVLSLLQSEVSELGVQSHATPSKLARSAAAQIRHALESDSYMRSLARCRASRNALVRNALVKIRAAFLGALHAPHQGPPSLWPVKSSFGISCQVHPLRRRAGSHPESCQGPIFNAASLPNSCRISSGRSSREM